MNYLTADQWTEAQALQVARLIVNPQTNGSAETDLSPDDVLLQLDPGTPALAAFSDRRAEFVVGLWPYSQADQRGILHVAGTGQMKNGAAVVKAFMDTLPHIEILTFTDKPALARLAQRAGFRIIGSQGGFIILERARASVQGPDTEPKERE